MKFREFEGGVVRAITPMTSSAVRSMRTSRTPLLAGGGSISLGGSM